MNSLPLSSQRLTLRLIREEDSAFLIRLVQSEGWLRFIGKREIDGPGEAETYIRNILDHPGQEYLVMELKQTGEAIGIITFLKRDHLPYPDLGFALLPACENQGYALEGCRAFLSQHPPSETMLAITVPENQRSVSLLKKLGFRYAGKVEQESKFLSLFRLDPQEH